MVVYDDVVDVTLNRRPGDALDWCSGNCDYVPAVQGLMRTHAEMRDLVARIDQQPTITYR